MEIQLMGNVEGIDKSVWDSPYELKLLGSGEEIIKISCGRDHFFSLNKRGRVDGWGMNNLGQLGFENDFNGKWLAQPFIVPFDKKEHIADIEAAGDTSLAIDKDGSVWQWGFSYIPLEETVQQNWGVAKFKPEKIAGIKEIVKIATSDDFQLALDKNGSVFAWGANIFGQLGNKHLCSQGVSRVGGLPPIKEIAVSYGTSFALSEDGEIWRWGGLSQEVYYLPHKVLDLEKGIDQGVLLTMSKGTLGRGMYYPEVEAMLKVIIKDQIHL